MLDTENAKHANNAEQDEAEEHNETDDHADKNVTYCDNYELYKHYAHEINEE